MKQFLFASLIVVTLSFAAVPILPLYAGSSVSVGQTTESNTPLLNPLTGDDKVTSIPELVNRIVSMAIGLSGVMALLAFVYGGVLYLMAGVNLDFLKKGKEVMKWAVIGLFVIFSSYAVITFVLTSILKLK